MRTLVHPGAPRPERVTVAVAPSARRVMTVLPADMTIHDAIVRLAERYGATCGCVDFLGGELASASYHVVRTRTSGPVVEYGPPIVLADGATLLHANGSFGADVRGKPRLHVHGALGERTGRAVGGHLDPLACTIAAGGIRAIVQFDVGFGQFPDEETGLELFFPVAEGAA